MFSGSWACSATCIRLGYSGGSRVMLAIHKSRTIIQYLVHLSIFSNMYLLLYILEAVIILYVFLIEIFSRSMQAHNAVNDELYLPFTQDCLNPVFKYCYIRK